MKCDCDKNYKYGGSALQRNNRRFATLLREAIDELSEMSSVSDPKSGSGRIGGLFPQAIALRNFLNQQTLRSDNLPKKGTYFKSEGWEKSDIEGDEYLVIDQILEYSNRIQMLIIEFHWIDKNENKFIESVKKLKSKFEIIVSGLS